MNFVIYSKMNARVLVRTAASIFILRIEFKWTRASVHSSLESRVYLCKQRHWLENIKRLHIIVERLPLRSLKAMNCQLYHSSDDHTVF